MNLSRFPVLRPDPRSSDHYPPSWPPETIGQGSLLIQRDDFGAAAPPGRPLPDLLPDHLRECTFARLHPRRNREAYQVCQYYAENGQYQSRWSLLLVGYKGAGKSSLAAAILHHVVEQAQDPHHARFWPLRRSLQAIRETWHQPPAQRLYLADLLAQPLPILDQVEGPTSLWEAHYLEVLLPLLWHQKRRMVVTTDLGFEELQQALGNRWIHTMLDVCHLVCVGG